MGVRTAASGGELQDAVSRDGHRSPTQDVLMEVMGVRAVMAFVPDPLAAAAWWSSLTNVPVERAGPYAWLNLGDGLELGFHPADEARNPRGGSPVIYWSVSDVDAARTALIEAGALHHRGPLEIAPGRRICQVTDPFGMIVGLDGP